VSGRAGAVIALAVQYTVTNIEIIDKNKLPKV